MRAQRAAAPTTTMMMMSVEPAERERHGFGYLHIAGEINLRAYGAVVLFLLLQSVYAFYRNRR